MPIVKPGSASSRVLMMLSISAVAVFSNAQTADSITLTNSFGGAVTVTTKGISTIPNLTLGKPAAIFDLSMGRRKIFFEPQFRFALEGKPWSFLFWWRYRMIRTEKMQLTIGAHPALSFKTRSLTSNGVTGDYLMTDRYLAGELSPAWLINKNVSAGLYYLYSHGLEKNITRHTNFISLRAGFSNIRLTDEFFLRFNPQVYYLLMDRKDGFYVNSTLVLSRRGFPVSISSQINKSLRTEIETNKKPLWNISLVYAFGKEYVEK